MVEYDKEVAELDTLRRKVPQVSRGGGWSYSSTYVYLWSAGTVLIVWDSSLSKIGIVSALREML